MQQQTDMDTFIAHATAVLVPIDRIVPGQNDRTVFRAHDIDDLAASIQQHGLLQPIVVRPVGSQYELVAGERRWRASKQAGCTTIPAIVRDLSDSEASSLMLAENLKRSDLDVIDEANAYRSRMERFGYNDEQLAAQANVSLSRVRSRLGLLRLVHDAQKLVRSKQLPLGHAELLAGLDGNRQLMALRLFTSGRRPSIAQFREVVGQLLAEQSQHAMFDLMQVYQERLAETETPALARETGLAIDPRLPELPVRVGGTGAVLHAYMQMLRDQGFAAEALTLSTLLDKLVRSNYAVLPA